MPSKPESDVFSNFSFTLHEVTDHLIYRCQQNCYGSCLITVARWSRASYLVCLSGVSESTDKVLGHRARTFDDYQLHTTLQTIIFGKTVQGRHWPHHNALPWMPYSKLAKKIAAFNCEVVHRPDKTIGHADGLSRTPTTAPNMIMTQPRAVSQLKTSDQDDIHTEWPNRLPANIFLEKDGNLLGSDESIAHSDSADFKTTREKARNKQFPMRKPNSNSVKKDFLWHKINENP